MHGEMVHRMSSSVVLLCLTIPQILAQDAWTVWSTVDTVDDIGDIEPAPDASVCNGNTPLKIQAREIGGSDIVTADENLTIGPTTGVICENNKQIAGKMCSDYATRYWYGDTKWMNLDRPTLKASKGDFELRIQQEMCRLPTMLMFRKDGFEDIYRVGENVVLGPTIGFQCCHEEQPDGCCQDYEVRYLCPDTTTVGRILVPAIVPSPNIS